MTDFQKNINIALELIAQGKIQDYSKYMKLAIGFISAVTALTKGISELKNQCKNRQEFIQRKNSLELIFAEVLAKMNIHSTIPKLPGQKFVGFIGPTSAGKSTLCNNLFGLSLKTGLGSCTTRIQRIKTIDNTLYWDMPAINSDFQFYKQEEFGFIKQLDKCFVLYCGAISDVKFISILLNKMELTPIFVRTKCDQRQENMKSVEEQLNTDRDHLTIFGIKYEKVIAVGYGMYEQIREVI